jgi:hypothetical protein
MVRTAFADSIPTDEYPVPPMRAFIDPDTNAILDYLPAPDLDDVAGRLIEQHNDLAFLGSVRLAFLWKREGGETGGKLTIGQCQKANPLVRYFGHVDLVIWLAADHLSAQPARFIEAALFHELLHAEINDKGKPVVRPHDYAGFRRELEEYGAWYGDLAAMTRTVRQLPLNDL